MFVRENVMIGFIYKYSGLFVTGPDGSPVNNCPYFFDVFRTAILVIKVISMFPNIDPQYRSVTFGNWVPGVTLRENV